MRSATRENMEGVQLQHDIMRKSQKEALLLGCQHGMKRDALSYSKGSHPYSQLITLGWVSDLSRIIFTCRRMFWQMTDPRTASCALIWTVRQVDTELVSVLAFRSGLQKLKIQNVTCKHGPIMDLYWLDYILSSFTLPPLFPFVKSLIVNSFGVAAYPNLIPCPASCPPNKKIRIKQFMIKIARKAA